MTIPDMDPEGFLPVGVHECSLEEIADRFGRFQRSDRRMLLYKKLVEYLKEVRSTGMVVCVVVDGSFVTSKDEPSDIDLVLVLPRQHDFSGELRPFEYNVLSRKRVRKQYAFDLLVARENSPEYTEYVEFFQQIKGVTHRCKGIVKVRL